MFGVNQTMVDLNPTIIRLAYEAVQNPLAMSCQRAELVTRKFVQKALKSATIMSAEVYSTQCGQFL
jgi:spermidine synthase